MSATRVAEALREYARAADERLVGREHPAARMVSEAYVSAAEALAHASHEFIDELASKVQPAPVEQTWTVLGVWEGDQAIPVGVIRGDHQVSGGDSVHFPEGCWATSVTAADEDAAEAAGIAEMEGDLEGDDADDEKPDPDVSYV